MIEPDQTAGFVELTSLYRATLQICDSLEEIADSLPRPDRKRCRQISTTLKPAIEAANRLEEKVLFPEALKRLHAEGIQTTIDRLREEHVQDGAAADEIERILATLSRGGGRRSWNTIGYMLRAYFLAVRRHVASEQSLLASITANPR
ncbi:hemerythrin domain-containing protein [Aminobacter sp. AP02]|uniref:hemerythrin domain-containing protein n=1 Tax=Aminobacter sp. AP02 TaxID=2135737 RepID=UPI000D6C1F76|nr:hemerythrin domain-containing protein [Aminobacter sp. AP02]PWK73849.1 hemerythrin HHE cation binding domain-containing protein [Aminobacter sp. AP02]